MVVTIYLHLYTVRENIVFTQNVESDDQFQQFYCQYILFVKRRMSIHVFPSLTEVLLYGVNKSRLLKCNRVEYSLLWKLHVANKNMCTEAANTGSFKHLPKSIKINTFLLRQSSESFAHHQSFVVYMLMAPESSSGNHIIRKKQLTCLKSLTTVFYIKLCLSNFLSHCRNLIYKKM
jgi:hypothetical protein